MRAFVDNYARCMRMCMYICINESTRAAVETYFLSGLAMLPSMLCAYCCHMCVRCGQATSLRDKRSTKLCMRVSHHCHSQAW